MTQLINCAKWLMSDKKMFRGQVDENLDRLVRLLTTIKNQSLGDALQEALEDWIKRPENQSLIEKHNLKEK